MKINMHEETPIQVSPKMPKKLIIIFWTWIGIIIGLLDFCLCYYAQQYLTALVLTIVIFVVIFICWLSIMDLKNSYIDIDENKIIVVEYNLGIRKTKSFLISEIHHITYSNGDALAISDKELKNFGYQLD